MLRVQARELHENKTAGEVEGATVWNRGGINSRRCSNLQRLSKQVGEAKVRTLLKCLETLTQIIRCFFQIHQYKLSTANLPESQRSCQALPQSAVSLVWAFARRTRSDHQGAANPRKRHKMLLSMSNANQAQDGRTSLRHNAAYRRRGSDVS